MSTNNPEFATNVFSQKITPFLWFDTQAQEAARFYVSVFKNSKITQDSPFVSQFKLDGLKFTAFNAGPQFKFSEAISFYVDCRDQEEVDYFWNKFIDNGGMASQCGWLKDKWGVSWQIVPKQLVTLMNDSDQEKTGRVREALMGMTKIIVADLEKAYQG